MHHLGELEHKEGGGFNLADVDPQTASCDALLEKRTTRALKNTAKDGFQASQHPTDDDCCSVCMELLFPPVMLGCAHMFCLSCLLEIRRHELATHNAQCPLCRTPMPCGQTENGNYVLRIGAKGTPADATKLRALHERLKLAYPFPAGEQLKKSMHLEQVLLATIQQQVQVTQQKRWTQHLIAFFGMPNQLVLSAAEYVLEAALNVHRRFAPACATMLPFFHSYPRAHLIAALLLLLLVRFVHGIRAMLVSGVLMGGILSSVYDFGEAACDFLIFGAEATLEYWRLIARVS